MKNWTSFHRRWNTPRSLSGDGANLARIPKDGQELNGAGSNVWTRALAALVLAVQAGGLAAAQDAGSGSLRGRDEVGRFARGPQQLDESLELTDWTLLPEQVASRWGSLAPATQESLEAQRSLAPDSACMLQLVWHLVAPLRDEREIEIELVQKDWSVRQRFPLAGRAGGAGPPGVRLGTSFRVAYPLRIPAWAEAPLSVHLRILYGSPVRRPVSVALGVWTLSRIRARASLVCALAASGGLDEAALEARSLLAEARSLDQVSRCVCEWPELLERAARARCALAEGRVGEAARLALLASFEPLPPDSSLALALVELAREAEARGSARLAEALYLGALRSRPLPLEAALGLERLGSARADEAFEAIRDTAARSFGPQQWAGRSGAALFSNGTASLRFTALEGPATIEIRVRGEPAAKEWPRLRAQLNGQTLAEAVLEHPVERPWRLDAVLRNGENVLEVRFLNDLSYVDGDRNAYLGSVSVLPLRARAP